LMAAVLVVALAVGATRSRAAETAQDRVNAVAETIKCPICAGEAVSDSNATISKEIRRDIAERVTRGESDDAIRSAYVEIYGDDIVLTPASTGVTGLVWAIPAVVAVLAIAGLIWVFGRARAEPVGPPSDADRALVDAALVDLERDGGAP
jgi:cytochrome c-type biogenesis protein CcmH